MKKQKGKILIVDDEPGYIDLFSKILSLDGYYVKGTDKARNAIKEIKKNNYDLIIMDMMMPDINGIDTIEFIRKINKKIKFLIITGYDIDKDTKKRLKKQNVLEIVYKPFDINKVKDIIARILK